MGHWSP